MDASPCLTWIAIMISKSFPLHAILTMKTGKVMGPFRDAHELAEWVMGHPVWTHELLMVGKEIEQSLSRQFPNLPTNLDHVDRSNFKGVLAELETVHGSSLEVERGIGQRTKNPLETAVEVFSDRVVSVN